MSSPPHSFSTHRLCSSSFRFVSFRFFQNYYLLKRYLTPAVDVFISIEQNPVIIRKKEQSILSVSLFATGRNILGGGRAREWGVFRGNAASTSTNTPSRLVRVSDIKWSRACKLSHSVVEPQLPPFEKPTRDATLLPNIVEDDYDHRSEERYVFGTQRFLGRRGDDGSGRLVDGVSSCGQRETFERSRLGGRRRKHRDGPHQLSVHETDRKTTS